MQRRTATAVVVLLLLLLYTARASLEEYGRSKERGIVGGCQEERMWCESGCAGEGAAGGCRCRVGCGGRPTRVRTAAAALRR